MQKLHAGLTQTTSEELSNHASTASSKATPSAVSNTASLTAASLPTIQEHAPPATLTRPMSPLAAPTIDLLNKKDGFGDYHLFDNNCEAFAVFCTTENRVSDQACSAVMLLKAGVKLAMDRLLRDVSVHHGPDKLKQIIDNCLANMYSLTQIITELQKHQDSGSS